MMIDKDDEIWRDIPGYEGYYQVSSYGRLRSLPRVVYRGVGRRGGDIYQRIEPREIHQRDNGKGYLTAPLSKEGKVKRLTVHRLVAKAFIPNPHNLPTVNHKDGHRNNNNISNLEWCTQSENILHAYNVTKTIVRRGRPVRCVETGEVYPSISDAAKTHGVADTNLGNSIRGIRQKRCAGYHWEFV